MVGDQAAPLGGGSPVAALRGTLSKSEAEREACAAEIEALRAERRAIGRALGAVGPAVDLHDETIAGLQDQAEVYRRALFSFTTHYAAIVGPPTDDECPLPRGGGTGPGKTDSHWRHLQASLDHKSSYENDSP